MDLSPMAGYRRPNNTDGSAQVLHIINDTASKFVTSITHSAAAQAMPISASVGFMTGMFLGLKH
jgi:quinol-cytochrome oxidoreductase complex cytochrome b subunit